MAAQRLGSAAKSLGRYKVIEQLRNIQWCGGFTDVLEYIVTDPTRQPAQCLSARAVLKRSADWQWEVESQRILQTIELPSAQSRLLLPIDKFEHDGEKGRMECMIYPDVIGPDLEWAVSMIGPEDSVWPASQIRNITKQTLNILKDGRQSMTVLDLRGISIRLVYPALNYAEPSKIRKFFQFDEHGFACLNDTCSGPEDTPYDPNAFVVKLDALGHSFGLSCCPEVVLSKSKEPANDMWALGTLLFDVAAGAMYDFEAGRTIAGIPSPEEGLVRSQVYLGKLPSQYADIVSRSAHVATGVANNPSEAIYAHLAQSLDTQIEERSVATKNDRLTEDDLKQLADLLLKMMDYNPRTRITPEEALRHPFLRQ